MDVQIKSVFNLNLVQKEMEKLKTEAKHYI